jgi:hypothetical protein
MKRIGLPIALWLASGAVLSAFTSRIADWFVMTDELLYERLALSVDRLHTPIPHVHGVAVGSINQLYPLLLAPVFASGTVADGLHRAHVLNAFVITSAAVPAYLLALRVTRDARASALASLLTVIVPWIVLSSFLLTEVAAYPAFVWALVAFHVTLTAPSPRNDALAAIALVVAVVARTQFVVLAVALPVAILLGGRWRAHRVLAAVYAAGLVLALVVAVSGHSPLGTYGSTTSGNPLPPSVVPAFFSHLAAVAIGMGLLPFVLGGAWLLRREPFALLAGTTIVLLTLEVSSYDERFGGGIVRDRYAFYVVPLFAIAFAAALAGPERPSWRLAVPVVVLTIGVLNASLPVFEKLNVDTPVSILDGYLQRELGGLSGARTVLIVAGLLAAALAVEATLLLGRFAAVALAVCALVLASGETAYAFVRLVRTNGTAGRPLTDDPSGILSWIDRAVGAGANVTLVPFPVNAGEFASNEAYWWDAEFWNESATAVAGVPGEFEWTPTTFPKLALRFDRTGRANATRGGLVLQAVGDTRFHLAGTVVTNNRNAFLVQPEQPWRADWSAAGLYDDGWTRPGAVARVRVYPYPGQQRSVLRQVTVSAFNPEGVDERKLTLGGKSTLVRSDEASVTTNVCVPRDRAGELAVRVDGESSIPSDPSSVQSANTPRTGGVLISRIYLSGQNGGAC